jgi:hypothetical protein
MTPLPGSSNTFAKHAHERTSSHSLLLGRWPSPPHGRSRLGQSPVTRGYVSVDLTE